MPVPGSQRQSAGTRSPTSAWRRAIRPARATPCAASSDARARRSSRPTIAGASSRTPISGWPASTSTRAIRAPPSPMPTVASRSARAADLFVANLLVVRGAAHEALGEGPAAAEDYHQALVINDRLLAETLARTGRTPRRARGARREPVVGDAVLLAGRVRDRAPDTGHARRGSPRAAEEQEAARAHRRAPPPATPSFATHDAQAAAPDCARIGQLRDNICALAARICQIADRQPPADRPRRALHRRQDALQERRRTRAGARLPEEVAVPARTPR